MDYTQCESIKNENSLEIYIKEAYLKESYMDLNKVTNWGKIILCYCPFKAHTEPFLKSEIMTHFETIYHIIPLLANFVLLFVTFVSYYMLENHLCSRTLEWSTGLVCSLMRCKQGADPQVQQTFTERDSFIGLSALVWYWAISSVPIN